jgi:predicted membrane protein
LRLRCRSLAVAVVGDLDLDLRDAEIASPETTLTALAIVGDIDVYVPEGVRVDVAGITMFGRRRNNGNFPRQR